MWLLPRLRVAFGRRPWLHPALVGAAALLVWWQAAALHTAGSRARDAWGETRQVWVADAMAAPGAVVHAHRDRYPRALVPADSVVALSPAAIAGRDITKGAVLVAADLADDLRTPADWVVFAVPPDGAPAVRFADRLTVFGGGHRVCDGIARTVTTDRVEVAVPPDCAAAVSAELIADQVVLARSGS